MSIQERISLVVVYEGRLGSSRADSTFVLKNAHCFSNIIPTSIWVSKRRGWKIPQSVLTEHDVVTLGKEFDPKTLVSSIFHQLSFGIAIKMNLSRSTLIPGQKVALIFHDWWPLLPLITLRKRKRPIILLEVHRSLPRLLVWLGAFSHINVLIATNKFKYDELHKSFNGKMIYERNAVDLSDYTQLNHRKLRLQTSRTSVLYTGSLGIEKNPEIVFRVSERMPAIDFVIVGSTPRHWQERQLPTNLILLGPKPHQQIPSLQINADLLLVTLDPSDPQSALYTSTMKLFEYIASSRPIIAPRLPSILEVLSSREFYSYEADSVESLEKAVLLAIKELPQPRLPKAANLKSVSWQARNARIFRELVRIAIEESG